ncbi:hypothetical protein ACFPJ4_14160 [Lysinimonas soli]|uniref:Polysaccharide biosynthesis protein n=1 Tax=Lysinimonas soli TaxID=1074233 RepID=A0ABW0NTQ3_9MICO
MSSAVVPAAILSIASHTFSTSQQGFISVTITASTFVSQLVFAAIVEARLSSPLTARRVIFPRWLAGASILAAIVVAVAFSQPIALCAALPVLLTSLEVGRGVSVAERLDSREAAAAILVGAGALAGVVISYLGGPWGLIPLAVGIASATIVRSSPMQHAAVPPQPGVRAWVVADVAITGVIYPALNTLILLLIGPVGAVLFTAISTVSGLLAIPLNFMRLRLLKAHSSLDVWVSAAAVALATIVIGILEFSGILGFVFRGSWTVPATAAALGIACLWRAASLATTLPFAALRRAGHVKLLTVLRGCCALVTFGAGVLSLSLHSLTIVFVVLLLGELAQASSYEIARRRLRARLGSSPV